MTQKTSFSNYLVMFALFISGFGIQARQIITTLLLIEISTSFNLPVGVTGQLVTVSSVLAMITALTMGILTTRINSKPLLQTGLFIFTISGVGCYLSPTFPILLIAYSLSGIGSAMVLPMLGTIIGEHIPADRRSQALGVITAGQPISFVVGSPIVAYLASLYGWKLTFLNYMTPVVILSLVISTLTLPKQSLRKDTVVSESLFAGFKGVISNRSAVNCLISALLFQTSMFTGWTYVISYLREIYQIPSSWATALISIMALGSATGNLSVGRVISRLGKRRTVSLLAGCMGLACLLIYNPLNLLMALALVFPWAYFAGSGYVSGDTLTLDQVPEYRGTIMSLNILARNLGMTLGGLIGGVLLVMFGYSLFGLIMGGVGVVSALTYYFFTIE